MGKNKIKASKELNKNEPSSQIPITKEQKMSNLVNKLNNFMFESLQSGSIKMHDPQSAAKSLIRKSNKFLFAEILNGQIKINQFVTPFNLSKRKSRLCHIYECNHDSDHQKITTNNFLQNHRNQNLKELHQNIRREKQVQKSYDKKLQKKAKQFILKVQKQREQFEQSLKNKVSQSQSQLLQRAFSEDTIRKMKQNIQEKKQQRRRQLTEKIQSIEKRKLDRVQKEVNNQISYWQKVKKYESLKHLSASTHQQTPLFPQINLPRSITQRQNKKSTKINRYSQFSTKQLSSRSLNKKFQNIDNYVLKAKLKLQNFQNKQKTHQLHAKKSSLPSSQIFNDLFLSNRNKKSQNPQKNQNKIEDLPKKVIYQLHKINFIRKKSNEVEKIGQSKSFIKNDIAYKLKDSIQVSNHLQINASLIKPSKNLIQQSLQSSWNEILNKIKFHEVDKIKGLSNLGLIQKRLDKIDREGILSRLKIKARVIDEMQNDEKQLSNQQKTNIEVNDDKIISSKCDQQPQQEGILHQKAQSGDQKSMSESRNEFMLNQQITTI